MSSGGWVFHNVASRLEVLPSGRSLPGAEREVWPVGVFFRKQDFFELSPVQRCKGTMGAPLLFELLGN